MPNALDIARTLRRASLAVLLASAAACSLVAPVPVNDDSDAPADARAQSPDPHGAGAATPQTYDTGANAAAGRSALPSADDAELATDGVGTPAASDGGGAVREIAVLYSGRDAEAADVAARIVTHLPGGGAAPAAAGDDAVAGALAGRFSAQSVDIDGAGAAEALATLQDRPSITPVAVGLAAFEVARRHLGARPIVFCQVFNYESLIASGAADGGAWGVSPLPPLALQLRGWKGVDRSLERVGLVVGDGHASIRSEAERAAAASGLDLATLVSSSDRETLYLFKRLAPQVDGLWLFPDNRILSPAVLEELLDYALSHGVSVLVNNAALLPWGALLSATARADDVAAAAARVAASVASNATEGLGIMTELSEVEFELNSDAASRLGLPAGPATTWVLREPD